MMECMPKWNGQNMLKYWCWLVEEQRGNQYSLLSSVVGDVSLDPTGMS